MIKKSMILLASSLDTNVKERLQFAQDYLGNSFAIIDDEGSKYSKRVNELQEKFEGLLDYIIGEGLNITHISNGLQNMVEDALQLLSEAEQKSLFLNKLLNSPPMELLVFITRTDVSVESLFESVRQKLYDLRDMISDLTYSLRDLILKNIVELFEDGKDIWSDAVVEELKEHFEVVNRNKDNMMVHLSEYRTQVEDVLKAFDHRDRSLGNAINGNSGVSEVQKVKNTDTFDLKNHLICLQSYIKKKNMQIMLF
ncbi:hypothetical protein LC087_12295 [Bacillus carboniphilus]|uniref:Uncharacterized protein n=1 Tax=Bacillus carboniphilus TaxID=86663 RepID=A0ABY9JSD5_9BACI|nr:hypothetical protein [Bacillus carboniphilus]WLR41648.1 hypothetical protein LC087_12295 [Bacillus carboniphilus]